MTKSFAERKRPFSQNVADTAPECASAGSRQRVGERASASPVAWTCLSVPIPVVSRAYRKRETIRDSPVPYRAGGGHRSTKESRPRALRMQMVLGCRMNRERRPTNGKGTDTPSSVMLYIRDRKGGEPNYFSVYMISYSRGKVKSSRCLFTNYSRMKIDPFRIMSGLFARLICERHFAIPRAVFAAHFSAFTLFFRICLIPCNREVYDHTVTPGAVRYLLGVQVGVVDDIRNLGSR